MHYGAGLAGVMCSRRSGMGPTSYNIVIVHWLNYGPILPITPLKGSEKLITGKNINS